MIFFMPTLVLMIILPLPQLNQWGVAKNGDTLAGWSDSTGKGGFDFIRFGDRC
jgi:hypothetical protein